MPSPTNQAVTPVDQYSSQTSGQSSDALPAALVLAIFFGVLMCIAIGGAMMVTAGSIVGGIVGFVAAYRD